jgi:hypothetical protein
MAKTQIIAKMLKKFIFVFRNFIVFYFIRYCNKDIFSNVLCLILGTSEVSFIAEQGNWKNAEIS